MGIPMFIEKKCMGTCVALPMYQRKSARVEDKEVPSMDKGEIVCI